MLKVIPGEAALLFREGEEGGGTPVTLLLSDLHLGLEKEMASKGFRIPPYSMKMLERIRALVEANKVERVLILGDVKHSIGKVEDIDWSILPWFFETLLDLIPSVEIVPGNHDGGIRPLLPGRVKVHPADGVVLGTRQKAGVTHGHSWPSREVIASRNMVIGHSHFRYEMRDRFGGKSKEAVWLFAEYDVRGMLAKAGRLPVGRSERGRLIVMPPFNNLVGGQAINARGGLDFGPVLSSGEVSTKDADIFLLDGTRVG